MTVGGSTERAYEHMALSLSRIKSISSTLGGTVNDTVMALVAGAVRRLLQERQVLDDLGAQPLIGLIPRSTRSSSDGRYGNHLMMLLPQLATHVADPRDRFKLIHDSVRAELKRSHLAERLAPLADRPFAARNSRQMEETGTFAGNTAISNVPGPNHQRFLAEYPLVANYPVPNVVVGQFLNVTLRRYIDELHLGLMNDVQMMGYPRELVPHLVAEFALLESLSP